jgi:hypothetical protein
VLTGSIGLVRFPDFFLRLHAPASPRPSSSTRPTTTRCWRWRGATSSRAGSPVRASGWS